MLSRIDLRQIVELRTLVLSLGEMHNFGWWKSQFLSPTGLSILERLYPNTYFATAIRSGTLAALEVHDVNIGKGRVFHLYRLSQNTEYELELILKDQGRELEKQFQEILGDQQKQLAALSDLANGQSVTPASGPILLNNHAERIVPTLAASYLEAFHQGKQVFPYFEEIH